MVIPLVLVTGFGPFAKVERNPSGVLALALSANSPPACRVDARVLTVTFAGVPGELNAFVGSAAGPSAILGMGVHHSEGFRLEERTKGTLDSLTLDTSGQSAGDLPNGRVLKTDIDLGWLATQLRPTAEAQESSLCISKDAGGYVCDWTYQHILQHAERLGIPGLFLHVPPLKCTSIEGQLAVAKKLVCLLAVGPRRVKI